MSDKLTEPRYRYPGAGPFQDDALSRKMFFGREKETVELTSRVEVCQLTVVYGRSGLGKSSLLQAGLSAQLRESGHFPVFVRVNHTSGSLIAEIADYVEAEANRQGVEHERGVTDSPWEYFKTLELWAQDRLLIPVIIFDQFEEVFSINDEDKQDSIIGELAFMIRGTPSSDNERSLIQLEERYGSAPPVLRVVVAIREDYLGHLEEIASYIPGIFDSRYRVTPLGRDAAKEALMKPAAVVSNEFKSREFCIHEDFLSELLNFLSSKRSGSIKRRRKPGIEPFQLQLIGRRIEDVAIQLEKTKKTNKTQVTLKDIGGEKGLNKALRDFYFNSVAEVKGWRNRKRVKALCLDHLIGPNGRRQSLEKDSIVKTVGLDEDVLQQLAASRLLRTDTRADTQYYELSHDTLVAPILESQGISEKSFQFIKLSAATFVALFMLLWTIVFAYMSMDFYFKQDEDDFIIAVLFFFSSAFFTRIFYRRSINSYKKHTRLRRAHRHLDGYTKEKLGLMLACISVFQIVCGLCFVLFWPLLGFFVFSEYPGADKVLVDRIVLTVGTACLTIYGAVLIRRGYRNIFAGMRRKENLEEPISSQNRKTRTLIHFLSKILFLLASGVCLFLLLSPLIGCEGAYYSFLSDTALKLRLSDLAALCEDYEDDPMEDFWLGVVFLSFIWFGIYQLFRLIHRRLLS